MRHFHSVSLACLFRAIFPVGGNGEVASQAVSSFQYGILGRGIARWGRRVISWPLLRARAGGAGCIIVSVHQLGYRVSSLFHVIAKI